MPIDDFEDLRVYQRAFEVAVDIFDASKRWPKEEKYALTDQIRRSSRSVCANISEAWFKRRYPKHFVSKLSNATSEAAETLTSVNFAKRCGYLPAEDAANLVEECRGIIGGLVKMMSSPDKWCPSSHVRESDVDYLDDF